MGILLYEASHYRRRRQTIGKLLAAIAVIAIAGYAFYINQPSGHPPTAAADQASPSVSLASRKEAVQKVLDTYPNISFAIDVRNLKTDEDLSFAADRQFIGASTTKLITAAGILDLVDKQKISLNDPLGDYTVEYQLEQLINKSNNDSWQILFDTYLGPDKQQSFAKQIGLGHYDEPTNSITASDLTILLGKLYHHQLLSDQSTNLLLGYMQNTNEERFIPAGLSSNLKVYDKTGLLDDNVHDAAIIDDGENQYTMVILSNGNGIQEYDNRAVMFHQIEQAIFGS